MGIAVAWPCRLFSNWDNRRSILYLAVYWSCKPIPPLSDPRFYLPPFHITTRAINQCAKASKIQSRSLWCHHLCNKREREKAKAVFYIKLNLFNLSDYPLFSDYVLPILGCYLFFSMMILIEDGYL